jgi:hypothetical protein
VLGGPKIKAHWKFNFELSKKIRESLRYVIGDIRLKNGGVRSFMQGMHNIVDKCTPNQDKKRDLKKALIHYTKVMQILFQHWDYPTAEVDSFQYHME